MKIRIKELFKSDLDPNSNEWWSKDKIDKINFNFNLLRNGGPIGPSGLEGPNGIEGDKGETGTEGNQGPIGNQGVIGPPSEGTWKLYVEPSGHKVIYPSVPSGLSGITIPVIGASAHIVSGTQNLISPFYGDVATAPINNAGSGALNIITDSPTTESGLNHFSSLSSVHLMLDKDVEKSFNIGVFSEDDGNGATTPTFKIYPTTQPNSNYTNTIKFGGDVVFDFISNQGNINTIGTDSIINYPFNVTASQPGETITFTVNKIKYNIGASLNNVLKSTDTDGTVVWENVASLFSILPIGSIVRIPSTSFTSDNFYIEDSITSNNGPVDGGNGVYDIRTNFGSGKTSGMFAGWYICNGLKWGDGAVISYDTPNLNGFSYSFDNVPSTTYGNSPQISGGNSHGGNIIYAGADSTITNGGQANGIVVTGDTVTDLDNYAWNSQVNPDDENHIVFGEQISIIYLGGYDYTWSNYDPNVTTNAVQLSYHPLVNELDQDGNDISMQYSATLSAENLEWTANILPGSTSSEIDAYWNNNLNFNSQGVSTGIRCYQSGAELSTGWLWRASKCRYYINGTGFTGDAVTVEAKQLWTWHGEAVNDVDGINQIFPNTSALGIIPESDLINNNNSSISLLQVYTSNRVENAPAVGTPFDWEDYENTSHIWTVNGSNQIVKPATGWYRSIPYSAEYSTGGGMWGFTIPAGHVLYWRKYWNNSLNSFEGDHLTDSSIPYSFGHFTFASGNNSEAIACSSLTGYDMFFDSNTGNFVTSYDVDSITAISQADGGISWTTAQIYVRADGSSQSSSTPLADKGKYPLRKIKSDTYIPGNGIGLVMKEITGTKYKEINSSSLASGAATLCSGNYIAPTASITPPEWQFIEVGTSEQVSASTGNFQAGATLTYSWSVDNFKFLIHNNDSQTTDISFIGNNSDSANLSLTVTGPDMNGNIVAVEAIDLEIWGEPYD